MKYLLPVILLFMLAPGCGNKGGSDSPANAVNEFVSAIKEKNTSKAWTYLSKDSQKLYDNIAKNRNQSGKDYFEKSLNDNKSLGILGTGYQVLEERQEGDSAVVIIKTPDGQTSNMFTVKEEGTWRLDYARIIQESMEQPEQ
jgi:hypothetical protein